MTGTQEAADSAPITSTEDARDSRGSFAFHSAGWYTDIAPSRPSLCEANPCSPREGSISRAPTSVLKPARAWERIGVLLPQPGAGFARWRTRERLARRVPSQQCPRGVHLGTG